MFQLVNARWSQHQQPLHIIWIGCFPHLRASRAVLLAKMSLRRKISDKSLGEGGRYGVQVCRVRAMEKSTIEGHAIHLTHALNRTEAEVD
jgi:hypothetical protein